MSGRGREGLADFLGIGFCSIGSCPWGFVVGVIAFKERSSLKPSGRFIRSISKLCKTE